MLQSDDQVGSLTSANQPSKGSRASFAIAKVRQSLDAHEDRQLCEILVVLDMPEHLKSGEVSALRLTPTFTDRNYIVQPIHRTGDPIGEAWFSPYTFNLMRVPPEFADTKDSGDREKFWINVDAVLAHDFAADYDEVCEDVMWKSLHGVEGVESFVVTPETVKARILEDLDFLPEKNEAERERIYSAVMGDLESHVFDPAYEQFNNLIAKSISS